MRGTDIEHYLHKEGKQGDIGKERVSIDTLKSQQEIRQKDPKLLVKRIQSLEASPPTKPFTSFFGNEAVCFYLCVCRFPCASPSASTPVPAFTDGEYWCVSEQHSVEAVHANRARAQKECLDLQKWHTICTADILRTNTPLSFRAKLAGQGQGSAQDIEAIRLWEAADNLLQSVANQREWHMADTNQDPRVAIAVPVQMTRLHSGTAPSPY